MAQDDYCTFKALYTQNALQNLVDAIDSDENSCMKEMVSIMWLLVALMNWSMPARNHWRTNTWRRCRSQQAKNMKMNKKNEGFKKKQSLLATSQP